MIRKTLVHSETVLDVVTVEDIGRALMPIPLLLSTRIHVAIPTVRFQDGDALRT